ncbi:MAG: glycosyltransferase [Flavobacteriales bacterium]|nr:glycosyltransferase [Flavobacteriales bacterium]
MAPGEPILIICYGFPPNYGIGGRRWAKFAKELARRGHPVHVIRREFKGGPKSLWTADGETPGIYHHPLPSRTPAVFHRWPLTTVMEKILYRFWKVVMPWLVRGNWLDPAALWKRPLVSKGNELIGTHGIRNVVVTGAPFSLLVHALGLKTTHPETNLVGDLRDAWTWVPYYGQAMLSTRDMSAEKQQEAQVASDFDKLIAPDSRIVAHMQEVYGMNARQYTTIPHTIDPEDFEKLPTSMPNDGLFRMIYAGSFYGAEEAEAYFDELLRTFEGMRARQPELLSKCRVDFYITGNGSEVAKLKVAAKSLGTIIRFHEPLPPMTIFHKIAQSDLVVNFVPTINKDFLGTKFNEIFQLRRPLLHIGEPGLVSRTVVGRRLGGSLRVKELYTELPRIISGERKLELDPDADLSEFLLERVTDKLIGSVFV